MGGGRALGRLLPQSGGAVDEVVGGRVGGVLVLGRSQRPTSNPLRGALLAVRRGCQPLRLYCRPSLERHERRPIHPLLVDQHRPPALGSQAFDGEDSVLDL